MAKIRPLKSTAAKIAFDAGVTEAIVGGFLLGIGQYFVRLGSLFELLLGRAVALIPVGVVFEGEVAVGAFDIAFAGVAPQPEHFVVIPLGHWRLSSPHSPC